MSADNFLVVSPVGNEWWITQEFASSDHLYPVSTHRWKVGPFASEADALVAAHEKASKSYYEYGVSLVNTEIKHYITVEEIEQRIEDLAQEVGGGGDFERAHGEEDHLYRDVLRAIADGADNPAELAATALQSQNLDFTRVCA